MSTLMGTTCEQNCFIAFDRFTLFFSRVSFVISIGIDCGYQVISGFGRHLGLTDILGLVKYI